MIRLGMTAAIFDWYLRDYVGGTPVKHNYDILHVNGVSLFKSQLSVWNFPQSTTIWLTSSMRNSRMIRRLKQLLWANGILSTVDFEWQCFINTTLDLCSLSVKTSYHQISRSLEATRLDDIMIVSLWNLRGTSAALLPTCLSNSIAIAKV